MFKNMAGNIPGGNFLGGNFAGGNFLGGSFTSSAEMVTLQTIENNELSSANSIAFDSLSVKSFIVVYQKQKWV